MALATIYGVGVNFGWRQRRFPAVAVALEVAASRSAFVTRLRSFTGNASFNRAKRVTYGGDWARFTSTHAPVFSGCIQSWFRCLARRYAVGDRRAHTIAT